MDRSSSPILHNLHDPPQQFVRNVLAGDKVIGRQPSTGNRRYYHTDLLGSTRAVVEGASVVESYDFEPWGLLMPGRTLAGPTKEGFTTKERDAESGLDYFGARYYMAALARWTAVDPLAEKHPEWSPYNYVLNNPLELIDPDGRQEQANEQAPGKKCLRCHDVGRPTPEEQRAAWAAASRHCDVQCRDTGLESQGLGPLEWIGLAGAGKAVIRGVGKRAIGGAVRQSTRRIGNDAAQETPERVVRISHNRHPEAARHIDEAQAAGHPSTVTIDRAGSASRRTEAFQGTPRRTGLDRDEYPPAMFKEGGKGSSVRHISPHDNRGAGACIGAQCKGVQEGTKVRIETVP